MMAAKHLQLIRLCTLKADGNAVDAIIRQKLRFCFRERFGIDLRGVFAYMLRIWRKHGKQPFELCLIQTARGSSADVDRFQMRIDFSVQDFLLQCFKPLLSTIIWSA